MTVVQLVAGPAHHPERAACAPGQSDYREAGDNLYNLVDYFIYDDSGRQIASVHNYEDPNGTGNPELSSDRNFIARTYYNAFGQVEYVVTNFVGDILSGTPPVYNPALPDRNLVTRYYYDASGRQIATVRNYWEPPATADGILTASEIGQGLPDRNQVTRTYFNARGQVDTSVSNFVGTKASETIPLFDPGLPDRNLITTYHYDLLGRSDQVTTDRDTAGSRQNQTEYDPLGRVSETISNYHNGVFDPTRTDEDLITSYTYDLLGRNLQVTDPEERTRQNVYNNLGQTIQASTGPTGLNLTTATRYNAAGWVVEQINGEGQTVQTFYDALGRTVRSVVDPAGLALATLTAYDAVTGAVTTTDAAGTNTRLEYDNLGRLRTVFENYQPGLPDSTWPACGNDNDTVNVCTRYQYDAAGNQTQVTLANATVTTYSYDALGRLTQEKIDPGAANIVTEYRYDAAGNQIRLIRAPGTAAEQVTETGYDALGRVVSINYPDATPDVTYSYEPFGPRDTMLDGVGSWSYDYDQANRLTGVTGPLDNSLTYAYDGTGNRVGLGVPGMSVTYTYDPAGRTGADCPDCGWHVPLARRLRRHSYAPFHSPSASDLTTATDPAHKDASGHPGYIFRFHVLCRENTRRRRDRNVVGCSRDASRLCCAKGSRAI